MKEMFVKCGLEIVLVLAGQFKRLFRMCTRKTQAIPTGLEPTSVRFCFEEITRSTGQEKKAWEIAPEVMTKRNKAINNRFEVASLLLTDSGRLRAVSFFSQTTRTGVFGGVATIASRTRSLDPRQREEEDFSLSPQTLLGFTRNCIMYFHPYFGDELHGKLQLCLRLRFFHNYTAINQVYCHT